MYGFQGAANVIYLQLNNLRVNTSNHCLYNSYWQVLSYLLQFINKKTGKIMVTAVRTCIILYINNLHRSIWHTNFPNCEYLEIDFFPGIPDCGLNLSSPIAARIWIYKLRIETHWFSQNN